MPHIFVVREPGFELQVLERDARLADLNVVRAVVSRTHSHLDDQRSVI